MGIERLGQFIPTPEEQEKMRKEIESASRQPGRMPELIKKEAEDKLAKANARLILDASDRMVDVQTKQGIEEALVTDAHLKEQVFDEVNADGVEEEIELKDKEI